LPKGSAGYGSLNLFQRGEWRDDIGNDFKSLHDAQFSWDGRYGDQACRDGAAPVYDGNAASAVCTGIHAAVSS